MYDDQTFGDLVDAGQPTGEVVASRPGIILARGLEGAPIGALVRFETGGLGLVRTIGEEQVTILALTDDSVAIGTVVVLQNVNLMIPAGAGLIGRVVTPLLLPLDGGASLKLTDSAAVFAPAPRIIERQKLEQQLVTGVTIVDLLFPIVLGQRIAIMGDAKSGKSTFLAQLSRSQAETDRVVIHVMIGKSGGDVEELTQRLRASGALSRTLVIAASVFEPLGQLYLAPYVGTALAEYFCAQGYDVVVIFDDLTSHAKVYRELSLLSGVSPGRDSYPGDIFYLHSTLLERAGRFKASGKTITALPVVLTPGGDITAYLPTNIMSITDGQIIFSLDLFREGIKPAVNVGLSVSRVGGRAHNQRLKSLAVATFKKLSDYRRAAEYSHFGSELAVESRADLELGKKIYQAFRQHPDEVYTSIEQQLLTETVLRSGGKVVVDVDALKQQIHQLAAGVRDDEDYAKLVVYLLRSTVVAT